MVALIARLLVGPDPGNQLVTLEALLFALWSLLVATSLATAGALAVNAWVMGREMRTRMETLQVRLRMNGGLSVHGGSAGLAFCLNDLLAAYRSHPRVANGSWLWERFFRRLRGASQTWAATGIISADGKVDNVVLEPA